MEEKEVNIQIKNDKVKKTNPRKKRIIGLTFGFIGTGLATAGIATGVCYAIYSKMHKTYTITFERGEGYFTEGDGIIHIDRVLPFGQIAKPEIWNTDPNKVFAGWFLNDTDEFPILDTQNVTSNMTLKPKFVDRDNSEYVIVTFDIGAISGATLTGNTEVAIRKADTKNYFGLINKPFPYALNYNFVHWSKNQTDPSDPTSIMWTDTAITSNITLYPYYQYAIDEIIINGPDDLHIQDEWTYSYKILGCQSPIKWSVTNEAGEATTIATVDENTGLVKTKEAGTFKLTATPTLVPTKKTSKTITINNPYVNTNEVYCYGKVNGQTCWWTINSETLYSGDIKLTKFGSVNDVETIARADFNLPVYIGDKVAGIKDNFLKGCTGFNSEIHFQSNSDIASIGDNFLYGCSSFNKELVLPNSLLNIGKGFLENCSSFKNDNKTLVIPSSITRINSNFLYGCESFASEISIPNGLLHIESNFLYKCNNYNSTLTLPNDLESIGDNFMYGCSKFDKDFTIPTNIKQIGVSFMYECNALDGNTINIDTTLEPSKIFSKSSIDNETLALHDQPLPEYKIYIAGSQAQKFKEIFSDIGVGPYRYLVIKTE